MVDREIIREWLAKADDDFEFARINLEEEKPFFAQICFHFHQNEASNAFQAADNIRKFILKKLSAF
jgi:hypothetical protein